MLHELIQHESIKEFFSHLTEKNTNDERVKMTKMTKVDFNENHSQTILTDSPIKVHALKRK